MSLFARKPIAELVPHEESSQSLKRVLGAGDLIMLAIGAVIGAGIFGAIGTAAEKGVVMPTCQFIRDRILDVFLGRDESVPPVAKGEHK